MVSRFIPTFVPQLDRFMNRIYYWIVALVCLCAGCGNNESSYVITGSVVNELADGNIIYLSHSNGDELVNLDSIIVDGGQFVFRGVQEVPIMAYLRFKYPADSLASPALFVLENGTLSVTMNSHFSTVDGSLNNQEFGCFLQEAHRLDSLRADRYSTYRSQVMDGTMDEATEQMMYEADQRQEQEHVRLAYNFIVKNSASPAALWLLETMQSRFSEAELRNLISEFSSLTRMGKRPPIVEEITQRLRNAGRIAPGNPYIDVELQDNRGRAKRLSQYVGYTRYTVVGFWRSDSNPACRDMVKFAQLQRKYASRGATFLGISLDEDETLWKSKTNDLKLISYSQCQATNVEEVVDRYALVAVPSFLVIAPDGTIHARNLSMEALTTRLGELLPHREASENLPINELPDTLRAEENR